MPAKRSDFMVDLKTAYKIANDFFLENNYAGVHEARETDSSWLFEGKCKQTCYGTSEVCVPKDGAEPYIFNIAHEDGVNMWENARTVSI